MTNDNLRCQTIHGLVNTIHATLFNISLSQQDFYEILNGVLCAAKSGETDFLSSLPQEAPLKQWGQPLTLQAD
jgi:hypothetical protein